MPLVSRCKTKCCSTLMRRIGTTCPKFGLDPCSSTKAGSLCYTQSTRMGTIGPDLLNIQPSDLTTNSNAMFEGSVIT